jgi:hypothetical protein
VAVSDENEPTNWLIHRIDGKDHFGVAAIALLYGLSTEHINPRAPLSDKQKEAGPWRRNQAVSATGTNEVVELLRYWARRDLNLDVLDADEWVILMPAMNPN